MTLNNLPVYNIMPPENEEEGMFCISLVDEPAMETEWLTFNKDKTFKFAVENEEKHIVTGVAIRADVPIYRNSKQGEFYVTFPKDVIPSIVEKFMRDNYSNVINLNHDETTLSMTDAVLVESYFINKERGICPKEFEDIEDGSWMTSFKILNDDIWKQIKEGDFHGFSIEIISNLELAMEKQEKKTDEDFDNEIISKLELAGQNKGNAKVPLFEDGPEGTASIKRTIDLNTKSYQSVGYAVANQKIVLLNYNGNSAGGYRQVAISAYGTTTAGNDALRIYEYFGASESGSLPGWRILLYDDISEFHVTDVTIDIQGLPGYGEGETCDGNPGSFATVFFEVGDIMA